jgi:hypothetical protein
VRTLVDDAVRKAEGTVTPQMHKEEERAGTERAERDKQWEAWVEHRSALHYLLLFKFPALPKPGFDASARASITPITPITPGTASGAPVAPITPAIPQQPTVDSVEPSAASESDVVTPEAY